MGETAYKGDPTAAANSTERRNYDEGFTMGCYGLVEYSVCMSIAAIIVDQFDLYTRWGVKWIYLCGFTPE